MVLVDFCRFRGVRFLLLFLLLLLLNIFFDRRKFCFLFYTLPEQRRALGPISTPTMLGSVVPMVPMFWTAALAFSIRLQKKFHVPKIIVTIELDTAGKKDSRFALMPF